jgi:hypothetical protein
MMVKPGYLQLVPYYSILLIQRLSFTPSNYISERASILRSLAGLLYEKNRDKKKANRYKKYISTLAQIELKGKIIENQLRELDYEIYYGNVFDIDSKLLSQYSSLMSELTEIESSIINDLQEILGESIPASFFIPMRK